MMINTGEELDIVYTTDMLLVVTGKGNQTFLVVVKSEDEQSCVPADDDQVIFIIVEAIHVLIALMNVYILILHLMFKELHHTLLGQLLIIYVLYKFAGTLHQFKGYLFGIIWHYSYLTLYLCVRSSQ